MLDRTKKVKRQKGKKILKILIKDRLRVVSSFPLGDRREMIERAKSGGRIKKSERGRGEGAKEMEKRSLLFVFEILLARENRGEGTGEEAEKESRQETPGFLSINPLHVRPRLA